nr:MAG: putative RNA-dependent RNA polymerase [Picobirnavirus sp.]
MPKNSAEKMKPNEKKGVVVDAVVHYSTAFTQAGFRNLKTYLGNVWKGQPNVYVAPFAKGDTMEEILQDWNGTLVSIQTKWPSLYDFENDLAKKVGPMSVQKPLGERSDDIDHYYEDILLPQTPIDESAVNQVIREFSKLGSLRLRSQKETVEKMKKSTNSGSPYFTKRRNVVPDTVPSQVYPYFQREDEDVLVNNFDDYISVRQRLPHSNHLQAPAVIGWRGQEGGPDADDVKQRVVWMFPFAVNVAELQVYQPLIEKAQRYNLVPAWVSMESVDKRVTALFDTKGRDDLVVCTDFSKFDQHFNNCMQDAAKSVLTALLAGGKVAQGWLTDVFHCKYLIPLAVGTLSNNVLLRTGHHGMASGSGGTNVDETLTHRALQYEAAMRNGSTLNPNSQCLGDDGILSYPGITVEDVVEAYQSHGQVCNPDKQYASTQDCVYLRRWHHVNYREDGVCVGVYSTNRALGRLRYLERFMNPEYWSPEMVALRQLSIIENCKYHPLFEQFVRFCMKRDSYRLGIDIPGFLDNITRLAIEATDHMQDFLGYTKTLQGEGPEGIENWRVVKYLKSVR